MAAEKINNQLLEYWVCPGFDKTEEVNPTPIGFVSTSFTFDAEFFEEECLTRFLSMETEKENDGAAYLIEREEKLAGLHCGIALVDQQHCKGSRSLRWDLVSCRVKNGILHAKLTILQWSNCIRLIVASANLTKPGYCINQEIFAAFDYYREAEEDPALIRQALDYIDDLLKAQSGETVLSRYTHFRQEVLQQLNKWNIPDRKYKTDEVGIKLMLMAPGKANGIDQLKETWNNRFYSPPDKAYIISPFFDPGYSEHTPSKKLFEIMRQKGEAYIEYGVTGVHLEDEVFKANCPDYLQKIPRASVQANFVEVPETGINETGREVPRPLHAKEISLCNDDSHIYMIGSSNFTSAALGLGRNVNYEANVIFTVSRDRNPKAVRFLNEGWIKCNRIGKDLIFEYRVNEDSTEGEQRVSELPDFFKEAIISGSPGNIILNLNFSDSVPPKTFEISYRISNSNTDSERIIFTEIEWANKSKSLEVSIPWKEAIQPDCLYVSYQNSIGKAYWPVVISSQVTLPPVEALRNLPLEALLAILSSNQPLHRLLKLIERARANSVLTADAIALDPHKLVDTSGFLIQRTRRISYAMNALRERIEKPVFTTEKLSWKLRGPIGVKSLVEAIRKEAMDEEECKFLVAELALELSGIKPKETDNSLKASEVKRAVKQVIQELVNEVNSMKGGADSPIDNYSNKAFQKAANEL